MKTFTLILNFLYILTLLEPITANTRDLLTNNMAEHLHFNLSH